jgi:hypothetical protein
VKILVWVLVFLACAGVGALVASRVDPFPPGVEDPGARPTSTPPPTDGPVAEPRRLAVEIRAATAHLLHVGGACTSDWTIRLRVRVMEDGSASGEGAGRLLPGDGCSFATAQVQAERVVLTAQGHEEITEVATLVLALKEDEARRSPPGATDLGGLLATLPRLRIVVPVDGPVQVARVERPDGETGTYEATYRIRASCASGCD